MPRLVADQVPKYRHHKARGLAVVRLNGVDHYLGPWKSKASLIEYDRLVAEWMSGGRVVRKEEAEPQFTIVEIVRAYLRHAKVYYSKNGARTDEYHNVVSSLRPLKRLYGKTEAESFGPRAFKAIRQSLIDDGLARTTINGRMDRIRRAFRWAAAEEMVSPAVPQALGMVPGLRRGRSKAKESPRVRSVPEDVIQATLPHLSPTIADMVRIQRLTGMRPGELLIMRPVDIDRSGSVWVYRPHTHKLEHHDRERLVFLGPKAQAILKPYLLRPAESYCFSPAEVEQARRDELSAKRKTPQSCGNRPGSNRKGKPKRKPREVYDTATYARAIARAAKAAEVEHWSPNQLRHSAGTEIRQKFGLEGSRTVLGHSDADTSAIYSERDAQLAASIALKVG